MGKPGPNTDRSCSGYLPRYIVHRVSMNPRNDPNGMAPKMAKQRFAFDASTRTRFLKWEQFPLSVHHDRNRGKPHCAAPCVFPNICQRNITLGGCECQPPTFGPHCG